MPIDSEAVLRDLIAGAEETASNDPDEIVGVAAKNFYPSVAVFAEDALEALRDGAAAIRALRMIGGAR